ncbi:hypothetical protein GIB67_002771 [Kingdonia uniflora]|uniref:Uncharacterized protein n=1 Tax=Kingdonia uniflora TaxID=39325 RepID=A0A7J7LSX1_9MAGN|nr:hypothetical protein GIB67_002771 [Kingdonia uniflora]
MGGITASRRHQAQTLFNIRQGTFPETYLGIPLIQGRVTNGCLKTTIDKIKRRANLYVGKMVSMQGRVVLTTFILSSMTIYSMSIYKWPSFILKDGETIIRNLIWSKDPNKRKGVTTAWEKCCKPTFEGGFRKLGDNKAILLMKLTWDIVQTGSIWASYMKAKYFTKQGDIIQYYQKSSIWVGIKSVYSTVLKDSTWIIGIGSAIDAWRAIGLV